MVDTIHIEGLQTPVQIGVPDSERARWQNVEVDITVVPQNGFAGLEDDLEKTIDYERLSLDLRDVASARPRKLIETLAVEMAEHVLQHYPVREVSLTIRKFVLPGTRWVSVSVTRSVA